MAAILSSSVPRTISKQGKEEQDVWGNISTIDSEEDEASIDPGGIKRKDDFVFEEEREPALSLEEIVSNTRAFRENKLQALLLRPETLDLLEVLSSEDTLERQNALSRVAFRSKIHLYALAELVNEDLITFVDGKIILTDLCHRVMTIIAQE